MFQSLLGRAEHKTDAPSAVPEVKDAPPLDKPISQRPQTAVRHRSTQDNKRNKPRVLFNMKRARVQHLLRRAGALRNRADAAEYGAYWIHAVIREIILTACIFAASGDRPHVQTDEDGAATKGSRQTLRVKDIQAAADFCFQERILLDKIRKV